MDRMMERLKVVVVDDNHHMINIVKTILRGFGVKDIIDASNAADAFHIITFALVEAINEVFIARRPISERRAQ